MSINIKVLIVCSGNYPEPENNFSKSKAFVYDQMLALELHHKVEFDKFLIKGKGVLGYFSNLRSLRKKIRNGNYDLVHAHYSLSGILAVLASNKPVITTFHGSDINIVIVNLISLFASFFSFASIFVSHNLFKKSFYKTKQAYIIPCGVDMNLFSPLKQVSAREKLRLSADKKYILFSSAFNNPVKNYNLTDRALAILNDPDIEILELKGFEREEVTILFSAVDLALLTSFTEGSPQFVKEAMACNCPIVSTDVGDVREVIKDTEGCYIASFSPEDVAFKIHQALIFGKRTNGRDKIKHLDNKIIAKGIMSIYVKAIQSTNKTNDSHNRLRYG